MGRSSAALLIALVACTSGTPVPEPGEALGVRVISEELNRAPCVDGPDFLVALDELAWIDAYDQTTTCTPGDITLPDVDFERRFGVVAWWGPGCADGDVLTQGVDIDEGVVVVRAISSGEQGCEPAGGLESFLMVERPREAITEVVYVLDGVVVGSVEA